MSALAEEMVRKLEKRVRTLEEKLAKLEKCEISTSNEGTSFSWKEELRATQVELRKLQEENEQLREDNKSLDEYAEGLVDEVHGHLDRLGCPKTGGYVARLEAWAKQITGMPQRGTDKPLSACLAGLRSLIGGAIYRLSSLGLTEDAGALPSNIATEVREAIVRLEETRPLLEVLRGMASTNKEPWDATTTEPGERVYGWPCPEEPVQTQQPCPQCRSIGFHKMSCSEPDLMKTTDPEDKK